MHSVEFDPPFPLTQRPSQDLQCALLTFTSLKDICTCIQLPSCNDRLCILSKTKNATKRRPIPYLRVVGCVVVDCVPSMLNEDSPFCFVPRYGNVDMDSDQNITTLYRTTSRVDYRNNEYEARLQRRQVSIQEARVLARTPSIEESSSASTDEFYDDVFSLRWKRLPLLSKQWSEHNFKHHLSGSLTLCVLYIIVHGHSVVNEFTSLLTEYVKIHLLE